MAIALVSGQFNYTESDTGSDTIAVSYPNPTTAGNFLVLTVANDAAGAPTISSVTGGGATWVSAASAAFSTANSEDTHTYYAENITGGSAGPITVSWAPSGPAGRRLAIAEFSGVLLSSSIDKQTSAVGNSAGPLSSGNVTTTTNGQLLIGSGQYNALSLTATGWTAIEEGAAKEAAMWYQIQTSAGSVAFTGTLSGSGVWGAGIATFQAAAGGVIPVVPLMGQIWV